ncbi:MAG: hypothetical protein ACKO81_18490 [Planctomycetota bacterium]
MAKERKKKKAPKNEQLESFSADPSAIVESADDSQVGQTSEEIKKADAPVENKLAFGLWDLAALFSLICVSLGTLMLFMELQRFGNLFQGTWPWSVSTVEITAAPPPPSVE